MILLENVTAGHAGSPYLHVDRLELLPGRITTIAGKNGSGKSTLLKTVCALLPSAGRITVDGTDLRAYSHHARARKIAYLPQSLPPVQMKVSSLVLHGRYSRTSFSRPGDAGDREAVHHAMERMDLAHLADRSVETLSGGERTRAYLAMVIAQESDYLLLDEPASDMDIPHQQLLSDDLRKLADEGRGIIISSHDLPLSFTVSDIVCLMKNGHIGAAGTPEELAGKPDLMREITGACLIPSGQAESLYKYQLSR